MKIEIKSKEVESSAQYLLLNRHIKIPHLLCLCIFKISVIYLKELTVIIEIKKLLDDYFIKFVNRDMCLW